jgi:hypothetical protein
MTYVCAKKAMVSIIYLIYSKAVATQGNREEGVTHFDNSFITGFLDSQ